MRRLLIILFLLISNLASATEYYVKTGGNDASAGTSDGTAWANHPWMSSWTGSVTLAAGDIVYMNRGDTWTHNVAGHHMTVAQSGTSGNYITTTAYGTGNKPRIYHSYSSTSLYSVIHADAKSWLIFDNLHIEHSSSTFGEGMGIDLNGSTNPCHDVIVTNCDINNIPHHGIRVARNWYNIVIGDTTATETATTSLYSNHIYNYGYAGVGMQGANPATGTSNFKVYYNYIHNSTRTGTGNNAYGIYFSAVSGSYSFPTYGYMRYNNIQKIKTWEGLDIHGGSYIYIQDNYVKDFGNFGIMVGLRASGSVPLKLDHIYVDRNIIEQGTDYIIGSGRCFLTVFNPLSTVTSELYIRDNELFYTSRPSSGLFAGIDVGQVNGLTISGNKIYNGGTSAGNAAITVEENYGSTGNKNIVISKNFIKQWGPGIALEGKTIQGTVHVSQNIVTKTPSASFQIFGSILPSAATVYLYNNVFLNDDYPYLIYSTHGAAIGSAIHARNNIFGRATSGTLYYWYFGGSLSGTFTSDYNIYWNSSTSSPFYFDGAVRNWTYWTDLCGNDINSPNISGSLNPMFANAGGSYLLDSDFEQTIYSPGIDAGTGVGLTFDYFDNIIDGNPDIGVHEYDAASGDPDPPTYPTVTTATTTYVPPTSATSGGNVTDDGGATVTVRGVCYNKTGNPTTADSKTTDGSGTGAFNSSLSGLDASSTYYVRAYATNEIGTSYGEQKSFSTDTPPVIPTITTRSVSNIRTTTATSGGTITNDGNGTISAKGVCWAETEDPTTADSKTTDGTGSDSFNSAITGLSANTTYFVRAYATNEAGTGYGSNVEFTTPLTDIVKYYFKNGKVVTRNGIIQYRK